MFRTFCYKILLWDPFLGYLENWNSIGFKTCFIANKNLQLLGDISWLSFLHYGIKSLERAARWEQGCTVVPCQTSRTSKLKSWPSGKQKVLVCAMLRPRHCKSVLISELTWPPRMLQYKEIPWKMVNVTTKQDECSLPGWSCPLVSCRKSDCMTWQLPSCQRNEDGLLHGLLFLLIPMLAVCLAWAPWGWLSAAGKWE